MLAIRSLLSRAARMPFDVAMLLLLPLLLLALDPEYLYTRVWVRDSWIYRGYFLDLPGLLRHFPDCYFGNRLSMIVPGWLLHLCLPGEVATLLLHLGLFYATLFSLFAALCGLTDRRTAGLLTLLFGTQGFVLITMCSDYADGYVIAYYLAAVAAVVRAEVSPRRGLWLAVAGAAAAAMVAANLVYVILGPTLIGLYLVYSRRPQAAAAASAAAGAAGVFVGLGLTSVALGGPFLFLLPSLTFAGSYASLTGQSIQVPAREWLPHAGHLVMPLACAAGAVLFLVCRRWRSAPDLYLQSVLLILLAALAGSTWHPRMALGQFHFYGVPLLLPIAFLALAVQWRDRLGSLSETGFRGLLIGTAVAGAFAHAASVSPGWSVAVAGCLALAAVGLTLPTRSVWGVGGALALVLLADASVHRAFQPYANLPKANRHARARLLLEVRDWDRLRRDSFLAVHRSVRLVQKTCGERPCWFAYDQDEPLGCLLDRVVCSHCCRTLLAVRAGGRLISRADARPGQRVAVLSADPDFYRLLLPALSGPSRVTVRVVGREVVEQGPIRFTLTFLDLEPTPAGDEVVVP